MHRNGVACLLIYVNCQHSEPCKSGVLPQLWGRTPTAMGQNAHTPHFGKSIGMCGWFFTLCTHVISLYTAHDPAPRPVTYRVSGRADHDMVFAISDGATPVNSEVPYPANTHLRRETARESTIFSSNSLRTHQLLFSFVPASWGQNAQWARCPTCKWAFYPSQLIDYVLLSLAFRHNCILTNFGPNESSHQYVCHNMISQPSLQGIPQS